MSRGYKLPEILEPDGDVCIPVFIPNDFDYLMTFHKHIRRLTLDWTWERDDNYSAQTVRQVWLNRTYAPLIDSMLNGADCNSGDSNLGECYRMDTATEAFSFYPNDPFGDPLNDDNHPILSMMRWTRWKDMPIFDLPFLGSALENIADYGSGYFPNDCFVTMDDLPVFNNPFSSYSAFFGSLTNFWLPYVKIELEGEGQLEIELCNVPFGGAFVLIPDIDISLQSAWNYILDFLDSDGSLPETWIFTEVNRDVVSVPPELVATQIQEFEFVGDTQHTLHAVFVPKLNDEFPFVFPFGGVREIEACGSLSIIGSETGETITKYNHGELQHAFRKGVIMSTVQDICEGVVCAIEKVSGRILSAHDGDNVVNPVSFDVKTGEIKIEKSYSSADGTENELKWGASLEVYGGLLEYMQDFEDFYQVYTTNKPQQVEFMSQKWSVDIADITTAVGNYVDHREQLNPQPATLSDELVGEYFCYGASKQSTASYLIDNVATDLLLLLDMVKALNQEQYDAWHEIGSKIPRIGYDVAPCYRVPPEMIVLDYTELEVNSWNNILFSGKPTGHLWRVSIRCTELFTNANGDIFDGVYNTPSGGNPAVGTYKLFEAYNQLLTLKEGFGGELSVGETYVSEFEAGAGIDPRGYRWDIPFGSFTQGQLELTLTDLGKA